MADQVANSHEWAITGVQEITNGQKEPKPPETAFWLFWDHITGQKQLIFTFRPRKCVQSFSFARFSPNTYTSTPISDTSVWAGLARCQKIENTISSTISDIALDDHETGPRKPQMAKTRLPDRRDKSYTTLTKYEVHTYSVAATRSKTRFLPQ